MTKRLGSLTPSQFEIMQLLWDSPQGMSVAEIWQQIQKQRQVSRTTILNLVDRLEKRGWLKRHKIDSVFHYQADVDRQSTQGQLADEFIENFFEGSTSEFMLSLLGNKQISRSELKRLRAMLNDSSSKPNLDQPSRTKERSRRMMEF